jgi:Tol biopolymer transport system component
VTLAPGTCLGPYEIVAPLGAGGMGEVYRAHDSRLGREVAVKVLPSEVASNPERLRRFEQEARAASAIHHPNLLSVFDVGNEGGVAYLVTELLAGESLRELLRRGPAGSKKTIEIGAQLARGLAAAHEKGIVHRDLKPENLFLTPDGRAKILDFGLARIERPELAAAGMHDASTVLETQAGTVLGTVGYMAPEQVRGERADARSDLFSLGVVLHEMLAGSNPFRRDSVVESLNAILKEEAPDLAAAPPGTNPSLARVVARLLEKDPDRRFRSAHDLAFALEGLGETTSGARPPDNRTAAPAQGGTRRWLLLLGALALLIAGLAGGRWLTGGVTGEKREPVSFEVPPPDGGAFSGNRAEEHNLALAPDGRTLAYVAERHGVTQIELRDVSAIEPRALAGTEGADSIFWSPNGKEIGFFAGGKLKRIGRDGGPAQVVCDVQGSTTASWGSGGTIVYTQAFGPNNGLFRVAAGGGAPQKIPSAGGLPRWIEFLPDGRRFLYWDRLKDSLTGEVYVGDLESGRSTRLPGVSSQARYAAPGWLLYIRSGALVAQHFDAGRAELTGVPVPLASDLPYFFNGWSAFSVANDRALAYQVNPPAPPLLWLDRHGRELGRIGPPGRYISVRLSPDGRSAAAILSDPVTTFTDVWVIDLARGGATRLSDEPFLEWSPAWSPDGDEIAYAAVAPGPVFTVNVRRLADGAKVASLLPHSSFRWPRAWRHDGLFLDSDEPKTSWDLLRLPSFDAAPVPILQTGFAEYGASPSPDGRWLAFFSRESGRGEVELLRLDAPGRRIRVSEGAQGDVPRWRGDGRELFYTSAEGWLTAVTVGPGDPPELGKPEALFQVDLVNETSLDVTADGQRFLVAATRNVSTLPVRVTLDWQAALAKR